MTHDGVQVDGMKLLYHGPTIGGGVIDGVGSMSVVFGVVLFILGYDFGEGVIVPFDCEAVLVGNVGF